MNQDVELPGEAREPVTPQDVTKQQLIDQPGYVSPQTLAVLLDLLVYHHRVVLPSLVGDSQDDVEATAGVARIQRHKTRPFGFGMVRLMPSPSMEFCPFAVTFEYEPVTCRH